ncbi:MAG: 4-hydroxythreonine-4-phosphate dehydrogenase PdxA, partial [Bacteroidetes bacterium]|nr:4-hydroxythreonine-4-phosphate dehydrogenase PdxA [Bacteroidota bacterium]
MTEEGANFRIGISMGDINGIGIEVIIKTFMDNRMFDLCTPILYGSSKALSYHRKTLGLDDFKFQITRNVERPHDKAMNIFNCWDEEVPINIGEAKDIAGEYSFKALDHATNDLVNRKIDALVTAPLNKNLVSKIREDFRGHTEFIMTSAKAEDSLMLMVSENIKIGTVTNHIPIRDVAGKINKSRILSKIKILDQSLIIDFGIEKPKLAVLGLNPHAGDNGTLGNEENEHIVPAVTEAYDNGILVKGPYSADAFFGS